MSQHVRLDAYKKAIAAQRFGAELAADVVFGEHDLTTDRDISGFSGAATNVSTMTAEMDRANMIGKSRVHLGPPVLGRTALHAGDLYSVNAVQYLRSLAGVSSGHYPDYQLELTAPHVTFAPSSASSQVTFVNAVIWAPIGQSGVFNNVDLIWFEPQDIDTLIDARSRSLGWRHAGRLSADLRDLVARAKEENQHGPWISTESLRVFWGFVDGSPNLAYPQLALTPDGNIYASWRLDRQRLLSAQFMSNGDVKFVIFKPNPKHRNRIVRVSGLTTFDALINEIKNQGIGDWVLESNEG